MNSVKPFLDKECGYRLQLANGQRWHIITCARTQWWGEKLASIMGLDRYCGNGYPKLIFIRRDSDKERPDEPLRFTDPKITGQLPKVGWKASRFPSIQIWSHFAVPDVICEIGNEESYGLNILRMLFALYPIFQRAQNLGGLPFHAALVERDGNGILLAASGNMGKSTCCRRLCLPWIPLSDDETLVVRDAKKRYLAHPLPTWSDYLWRRSEKTWNLERHVPLAAIFFLHRADIDWVMPLGGGEAAALMTLSSMQVYHAILRSLDNEDIRTIRIKLFENACEIARSVPAFYLGVSLQGRFWEQIEKVLY